MFKLKGQKLDNILVHMYGIDLHIHEIKNISALESRIRTIYELEGIVEESDEAIKTMQAKIALACGNPEEVKRLMKLLKRDGFYRSIHSGQKELSCWGRYRGRIYKLF